MGKKKESHITLLGGTPICQTGFMLQFDITCGHESIAAAWRAVNKVQKEHGIDLLVMPEPCPTLIEGG